MASSGGLRNVSGSNERAALPSQFQGGNAGVPDYEDYLQWPCAILLTRAQAHVRAGCRLADRCGIGRTVFASLAGHAVGRDEVACNQPRIQPIAAQLACPVMRTAAGLQGHQAAGRQLRAPGRKLVSGQRLGNHHARIHRMHLVLCPK